MLRHKSDFAQQKVSANYKRNAQFTKLEEVQHWVCVWMSPRICSLFISLLMKKSLSEKVAFSLLEIGFWSLRG